MDNIDSIKNQIIEQIKSWNTSEDQKVNAIEQIQAMSPEELEEFLKKNNAIKSEDKQECPFCLIIQGKIPSYKLSENKDAIAVLEINPLSKGHTIIVPKKHDEIDKISASSYSLAKKISNKIKSKLKPKEINISTSKVLNHAIINVIPSFGNEKGERKKAEKTELEQLQNALKIEKKVRVKKEKVIQNTNLPRIPRKIP